MKKKKNLIILCADEMRGDCLGYMGNPDVRTPHLDRLAARGAAFRRHFATFPKCVPSRVSLMTGRYCHTDGYRTITQHLPANAPNLLSRLREAGYETALFGKNHCWDPDSLDGLFDHRGDSDAYAAIARECFPGVEFYEQNPALDRGRMIGSLDYLGNCNLHERDEAKTRQAIEFLTRRRDVERPFFLQLNIESPHPMYAAVEPWFSMYDREKIRVFPRALPRGAPLPVTKQREVRSGHDVTEAEVREVQALYYGMISRVDEQMGRVLATLEACGLMEDSILLFWSDHGDYAGQYGLPEKWDTHFADCLVHVPCVLCGEGIPRGAVVDELSDHTDLTPTLGALLGLEPLPGMHGKCLVPTFGGEAVREAVFADGGHEAAMLGRFSFHAGKTTGRSIVADALGEWAGHYRSGAGKQETYERFPDTMARAKMVRTKDWKLVMRVRGGNELYDLKADRWEMNNLYGEPGHEAVVGELQRLMIEWCLATDTDRPYQDVVGA